jgi:hypothetical protein
MEMRNEGVWDGPKMREQVERLSQAATSAAAEMCASLAVPADTAMTQQSILPGRPRKTRRQQMLMSSQHSPRLTG